MVWRDMRVEQHLCIRELPYKPLPLRKGAGSFDCVRWFESESSHFTQDDRVAWADRLVVDGPGRPSLYDHGAM